MLHGLLKAEGKRFGRAGSAALEAPRDEAGDTPGRPAFEAIPDPDERFAFGRLHAREEATLERRVLPLCS